jgi:hypothetical protein
LVFEALIFHHHAKWCKANPGIDVKMRDHEEERARIAIQEGKNIWVRVEESKRFLCIIS